MTLGRFACLAVQGTRGPCMPWAAYQLLKRCIMSSKNSREYKPFVSLLTALPPLILGVWLSGFVVVLVPLNSIVWGGATPLRVPLSGQVLRAPAVMLGLLVLVLVGGALVSVARRRAVWGHTWSTAAAVSVAMGLSILADDVPYLVSPLVDALMLVAIVLALAAVAFVAARRSMAEAVLVAMGFTSACSLVAGFMAVGSPMLRMDIALLMAPAGLAFALLILAFLRGQGRVRWIALVLTAALAAVLISASGAAVASAVSASLAWNFLRLFGVIGAVGLLAPLALGWVLALRRRPAPRAA